MPDLHGPGVIYGDSIYAAFSGYPYAMRAARLVALFTCTYPVSVLVAGLLRKSRPWLIFLPCIKLVGFFVSGGYR
jgi:hypothetical protein